MTNLIERNRRFLTDMFAGPFPGHGVIMAPPGVQPDGLGDFTLSTKPVSEWLPWAMRNYDQRLEWLERLQDDSVPYAGLNTNTGIFAAAFGCGLHMYEEETPAAALPIVETAEEADRLPEPSLEAPALARILELARLIRRELGPKAPIGVPDIQSPFQIAALIWRKQPFYVALVEQPDAVKRLVAKCQRLLVTFLETFLRETGECNLCHCPYAWAPPELGCWLSEDEAGSMSTGMFREFCLPPLQDMSRRFGGLFMHCCAAADHQYGEFLKVPNLRGLNRVFTHGPDAAVKAFAGRTVLMNAWVSEETAGHMLDIAQPDSRFLFTMYGLSLEEAQRMQERLRARCGRASG